jgi:hypothetical protein
VTRQPLQASTLRVDAVRQRHSASPSPTALTAPAPSRLIERASSAITIVPATMEHATRIDLREGDRREIAALGVTMPEAFDLSMSRALWADAYLIDGEVAALVGLSTNSLLGGTGSPWLFTGRPVDRHRKNFLRLTRAGVARMRAECPMLVNYVHADYREAIRWLQWLGFTITPPQPFGSLGAPFCRASIGEKVRIKAVAGRTAAGDPDGC